LAPDSGFSTGQDGLDTEFEPVSTRWPPDSVSHVDATGLRRTAQAIAWGRVAIGATALVAPMMVAGFWVGDSTDSADSTSIRLLARTLGGRDLALGAGTLRALSRSDDEARPWVALAGVSDAVDALATVVAFARLPRRTRWPILGASLGAALVSIRAATGLDTGLGAGLGDPLVPDRPVAGDG
jgi:hypothetical protein